MRKLPPLNALRAFEAAARHLSFVKAADELAVTPTAISHQVRLLEDITRQKLFRRRPRPIALTEAGESLFPVLRDGLDSFAVAVAGLSADADRRPLTVSTTTAFAGRWLVPRLAKLKQDIGLELDVEASEIPADLRSGPADFAIRYRRAPILDLECNELVRDRFIPVMSPALANAGQPVKSLADLAQHTLIHFRWKQDDPDPPTWQRYVGEARAVHPEAERIDTSNGLRFSEESHAIEAALAGQGIALVSDVLVRRELASGTLLQPLAFSIDALAFYVVYLTNARRRGAIEHFLLWARDEMETAARPVEDTRFD
ncbi:MAG: LysR substrate-binding domain-containing protein [Phyllobacteriaceae bacterium]|jgi:LysR family glycine cleavage system transcriptional activator|nr:LysR substrate-binding domain-containing protein [Phyllobacteriaceae bacterium]